MKSSHKSRYLTKQELASALNIPVADLQMLIDKRICPGPLPLFSVERWSLQVVVDEMRASGYPHGALTV